MTTSLSTNRLGNIFSRFRDNISQSNVVFENETVSTQFLGKPVLFNE